MFSMKNTRARDREKEGGKVIKVIGKLISEISASVKGFDLEGS